MRKVIMNNKIKIAQSVTRLEFGGVESILLNYISHMDKEKFDFHIITQDINVDGCIKQFEDAGVKVHIVTHKNKSISKNFSDLRKLMKKEKFDIVHSHMTLTNFTVLFFAKLAGVKVRISHSHNAFKTNSFVKKVTWKVLKVVNKICANVYATCGYDAGVFMFGKKNMDNGKVYMMNNAIDLNKFKYNEGIRNKIRQKYGINNEICIGHIGRFMEQKNHLFLVDIFAKFLKIHPDAKLMLIGSGELEENVKEYIIEKNIESSVIFTGNITNANECYQAMDVFALPSLFEGLPVVSIEAQAADLKCLVSDRVDKRCAITDNIEFYSIEKSPEEWAEKIDSMLGIPRDTNVLNDIRKAHYDIEKESKELEKLYIGEFE